MKLPLVILKRSTYDKMQDAELRADELAIYYNDMKDCYEEMKQMFLEAEPYYRNRDPMTGRFVKKTENI